MILTDTIASDSYCISKCIFSGQGISITNVVLLAERQICAFITHILLSDIVIGVPNHYLQKMVDFGCFGSPYSCSEQYCGLYGLYVQVGLMSILKQV